MGDKRKKYGGGMAIAVILLSAAMSGCATVKNGRFQDVLVVSDPPGATLALNGQPVGATPATIRVRRRADVQLQLQMPGYQSTTVRVPRRGSYWLLPNFIFLNPLAGQGFDSVGQWLRSALGMFGAVMTVDFISGGAFVRPNVMTVTLTPDAQLHP